MEKKKVFLAFSNAADQEDLIYIKSLLKKYDVDIIQFENGNYDKSLMSKCDYVFLVIPRQHTDGHSVFVGRGQYDQVDYLFLAEFLKSKTFLFYNNKEENCILRVVGFGKHDTNDYKLKYGRLSYVIESGEDNFPYFFQDKFSIIDDTAACSPSYSPTNERNIKDWLL